MTSETTEIIDGLASLMEYYVDNPFKNNWIDRKMFHQVVNKQLDHLNLNDKSTHISDVTPILHISSYLLASYFGPVTTTDCWTNDMLKNNDICAICSKKIEPGETRKISPGCTCIYHVTCMVVSMTQRKSLTCPECGIDIAAATVYKYTSSQDSWAGTDNGVLLFKSLVDAQTRMAEDIIDYIEDQCTDDEPNYLSISEIEKNPVEYINSLIMKLRVHVSEASILTQNGNDVSYNTLDTFNYKGIFSIEETLVK